MLSYSIGTTLSMRRAASQRYEYEALRRRLSDSQERELIQFLNGPEGAIRLDERWYFRLANDLSIDPLIRRILGFHILGTKNAPDGAGTDSLRGCLLTPTLVPARPA